MRLDKLHIRRFKNLEMSMSTSMRIRRTQCWSEGMELEDRA